MALRTLCITLFLLSPLIGAGQATAVVIGIADFQDPGITDLRYADDDARAFAEFLFSPMGADLPRDRVRLLTDTSATLAAIQSALAWQLSMAAEGQTAYLYLATHGDVEATDLQSSGFLLAHDTPRSNYDLLALSVSFLNDHLAALSEKHVMPVVVTDACHAGTLAGDAVAGRRLTAASLMQRQGTEVRMLACQPYELSHEGERWGGGRGAFSYHLLEGMRGAADEDRNRQIDLFELERYVQNRVSEDTDREQHPELFGDRKDLSLFTVASESQSTFQRESTQRLEVSFEESTVALAPPEAQRDYLRFRRALSAGALLMPEEQSALAYYRKLRSAPALLPLRGLLDERLTVALLDAVQQAIVAYLDSDPEELTARDRIDEKYRVFPLYLSTAAAILGPEDPRIPGIRAKEAYFRGMVLRLEADWNGRTDSSYHQALDQLESAVALQPEAAYLHNERGLILMRLANAEAAYGSFIEATRLAPTWALPYSNLGILLKQQNARANYQLAADYFDRAIALKPDLAGAYMNYGNLLYDTGRTDSAEILLRQALDLKPSDTYARYNLALLIGEDPAGRRDAQRIYAAIIEENQALVADSHLESGRIYLDMNLLDSAEHHLKQAIALQPTDRNAYALLRRAYLADGREEVSAAYFSELIATRPDRPFGYYNLAMTDTLSSDWLRQLRNASLPDSVFYELATTLGFSFYWEGRYLQAEESLKLATRSTQYGPAARFNLSAFLAATGQEKKTLAAVREALRLADNPEAVTLYCRRFAADADFEKLRSTEGFQKLYDKHCGGLPPPD